VAPASQALPALLLLLTTPGWAAPSPAVPAPPAQAARPPAAPRSPPAHPSPPLQPPKEADNAQLVEQAKAYFASGNEHYAAGRYEEAIRHFQAGYALVPRPNFLVNLGQSYRKVGDLVRAKEAYLAYVRALPQDSTLRDQALQVLAEIEVQLQERRPDERASVRPPPPIPVLPAAPPPTADHEAPRLRVWPWVTGGAGLALAGAGLVFQLRARSAGEQLSELTRDGGIYDPALEDRGRRDQRIGVVLLAGGGLALGAAAVMFLLRGDGPLAASAERAGTARRGWSLALGARSAGLELRF
jgi:tetratricopeptide (TPR) repeat protein